MLLGSQFKVSYNDGLYTLVGFAPTTLLDGETLGFCRVEFENEVTYVDVRIDDIEVINVIDLNTIIPNCTTEHKVGDVFIIEDSIYGEIYTELLLVSLDGFYYDTEDGYHAPEIVFFVKDTNPDGSKEYTTVSESVLNTLYRKIV